MNGNIYKITNTVNGKIYIGQTRQKPNIRFHQHLNAKDNYPIHAAFKKYGTDKFTFEVIQTVSFEDKQELIDCLNDLETRAIIKYDCLVPKGYNIEKGGNVHIIQPYTRCKNNEIVNTTVYLPENHTLNPQECFIFLILQLYAEELQCNVSYETLHDKSKLATKTISKLLKSIEDKGYITIDRLPNNIIYKFKEFKQGEPFSYEFLGKSDLTFTEKSYIVASQQYMFKDEEEGKISYTNKQLSALIKMPEATISKCNRSLQEKGYLEGASEVIKRFQLRELDQLFIWKLKEHEEKINKNTEDIAEIKKELLQLQLENAELKKAISVNNKYIL